VPATVSVFRRPFAVERARFARFQFEVFTRTIAEGCGNNYSSNRNARTLYVRYPIDEILMPAQTTPRTRDDRIELRASREQKRTLAAAAAYEHLDLTSFVLRTALPAAEEIVARHERILLSARDTVRIMELLDRPPKPTAALRAAAKRRKLRR
jgi:uncharacterized protein (DUF1778 family)